MPALLRPRKPSWTAGKAWRQGSFLIPLSFQHTGRDPARAIYASLPDNDGPGSCLAELTLRFTAADIHDVGPAVLAYGQTKSDAHQIADQVYDRLEEAEPEFDGTLLTPQQAVSQAIRAGAKRPIVIADVQDNPGAGASSDTTGVLRELVRQNAPETILGLIHDPTLAEKAHEVGVSGSFDASIGGTGPGDAPFNARVRVHSLSDGQCHYTGDMYGGGIATLGASAALDLLGTDIRIVVTSIRNQCLDLAQFRHFGLAPEKARILCVKSTAHFRADFEPISDRVLLCAAPGQFPCLLQDDHYSNLRHGVRVVASKYSDGLAPMKAPF